MQESYYQNILYPLQDRVLSEIGKPGIDFYLTGGTALSRGYFNHRYSDDLDLFLNDSRNFRLQVDQVFKALKKHGFKVSTAVADEDFVRAYIHENDCILKVDFVNDVSFRVGVPVSTRFFCKTDTLENILSNKLTALSRYSAKDIVDILFISQNLSFNWVEIFAYAAEKDVWTNPVAVAEILDQFPVEKLNEVIWAGIPPDEEKFNSHISRMIRDILEGNDNSLYSI
jgi:predicted nucleotidyltransferase component of viral defense system